MNSSFQEGIKADKKAIFKSVQWLAAAVILAAGLFLLLFRYDNKYTARAPVMQEGMTVVSAEVFTSGKPIWLADGWELYPDALLAPGGFSGKTPARVYVGQHLNLSSFHADRSPYGNATWRLRIAYDGDPAVCTVLLPEVFCAGAVYVNGTPAAVSGEVQPYRPHVRDLPFSFVLRAETELVIQTSNFTHYYGGITYPPALGNAAAIHRLTGTRMAFYGLLCFGSLAVALFSAAVWLGSPGHDRLPFWFGILALSFSLRMSYPFLRLFEAPLIRPLYAIEDAAAMLGLWCALRIALSLCDLLHRRRAAALLRMAGAMTVVTAVFPLLVLPVLPASAMVYGWVISAYKLTAAAALGGLAVAASCKGVRGGGFLIAGVAFYGVSLAANIFGVGVFEPAFTGWQDEYGAFVLVLTFAGLMVDRSRALVKENVRLSDHLQEEVTHKTEDITKLLDERSRFLSELMHDIKSPAATMLQYARLIRENSVGLDETTGERLRVVEEKCRDMGGKIETMQLLAAQSSIAPKMESMELRGFLERFHRLNQPDVEVSGIDFRLRLPEKKCFIRGDAELLGRMLQNLLYNAVSFTPPDGRISLWLDCAGQTAEIHLRDTGCGIPDTFLPRLFERFFTTRADDGGKGLGLYIVRGIVVEHGGEIAVKSKQGAGTEFVVLLPLLCE